MSDILIKGMKMPTCCYTCPCSDLEYYDCNLMPGTRIEQYKRLDNCPLVPAADVRPVVLCKDCKYNKGTKTWIDNDLTADCTNGHGYPLLDWFCADGVKREES